MSAQMDMSPRARLERLRAELDRAADKRKHHRKRANFYESHRALVVKKIAELEKQISAPPSDLPGTD